MTTTSNIQIRAIMAGLGREFQTLVNVKQILVIEDGIEINFTKGLQGINKVIINLNSRDTYDMHFWRITAKTCKVVTAVGDLQTREEVPGVFENITGFAVHF